MGKKLFLIALLAGLFFFSRDAYERYPSFGRIIDKTTESVKVWSKKGWESTSRFFKTTFSKKSLSRKWESIKAPFKQVRKKAYRKELPE